MKTAASDRAAAIFFALSQVPPDQRHHVLDEKCNGDAALRDEVERLLGGLGLPDSVLSPRDLRHADSIEGSAFHPGATIGGFVVIRQIGAGGTGVVYLAHQRHPPRVVALKVLRREFVASAVQRRFEIEAELLAHLQHPGIAQVYAAHPGDATTPPFIAMELVTGPPLTEFADARKLPIRERVELLARVCDAVQHAHQRGVIHRDLKPGNILVTDDGQPKVLDFGVARRVNVQASLTTIATETGQLVGTLAYMSPEQVEANPEAIDTRTDIHALGVILYRVLAGRLPFGHDDPPLPELARRIVQDDPPRLGTLDPKLRGDLEIIVSRAIAKEKERRYPSAAGLAADLRRYLTGQPISASADSAWYLVRRRLGRYRLALGLSGAALLAVTALASYASIQRARADRANVRLHEELATSTIERGRLMSLNGNHPVAEELVWRELFRRPDSRHAQWTLWEIYSRQPTLWTHIEHEGGTQTVRFSPDNRLLLTSGRLDGLIHLIDSQSGALVRAFASKPQSGTRRALFTPDGSTVVTGSDDGSLRLWDVATGELRRELPKALESLQDLAITGDGAHIVAVAHGGVQVWSLATWQRVAELSGLVSRVFSIATSPVRPIAIAGSDDGNVAAVDIVRRVRLWQVHGHDTQVLSVAVSPDGSVVASGSVDGLIAFWNAATGERLGTIASENGRVRSLSYDMTGTKLAAAGLWRTRLWDLQRPGQPPLDFGGSEGTTEAHIRPDGRALATCNGGSGQLRLWDLNADSRTDHWTFRRGSIVGLAVEDAGRVLWSAANDGVIRTWHPGHADPAASIEAGGNTTAFDVSADGRWLLSVGSPGTGTVCDARDGRRVATLPTDPSSRAAVFADGDRRIVLGLSTGALDTWHWSDGSARNRRTMPSQDTEVLALLARGNHLFVAHRNRVIVERDVDTGQEFRRFTAGSSPFSLALTFDARLLAAGTWLGAVEIWNIQTGQKLEGLRGQNAVVSGVDFSPDGSLLALASRDGSTRLWDVIDRRPLATVAFRKSGAERVKFFPDGRRLAIGYEDGEVEIRDLQYFFRYAAGQAEYELRLLGLAGESFPRAGDVLGWSRKILSR